MKRMHFDRIGRVLGKARKDQSGTIAVFTALALPTLLVLIGGGVDYAQVLAARAKLQKAADSASLATYKHFRSNPDASQAELKAYFSSHLKASMPTRFEKLINIRKEQLALSRDGSKMEAYLEAEFPTRFIKLIGLPTLEFNVGSLVESSMNYTEVALVLDTTSSMTGAKLDELKVAAKNFLETIHARLQGDPGAFKVAIVPFAEYVNVGTDKRNAAWIDVPQDRVVSGDVQVCRKWVCDVWGYTEKGLQCISGHHEQLDPCETRPLTLDVRWEGCVGSRNDPFNIEDGSYSVRVPGVMTHKRDPRYPEDDVKGWHDWGLNNCGSPLTPLTTLKDNKNFLIDRIDALSAKGFTYIPAGLVWGWRVLSNKEPFAEGASDADVRDRNVNKIIILMTDGANTRAPYDVSWARWADHGADDPDRADQITERLCNNIKAINPATGKRHAEIITVTFDVSDPGIKRLMERCASMGSFDASSGNLAQVFEQIAGKLAELHLAR